MFIADCSAFENRAPDPPSGQRNQPSAKYVDQVVLTEVDDRNGHGKGMEHTCGCPDRTDLAKREGDQDDCRYVDRGQSREVVWLESKATRPITASQRDSQLLTDHEFGQALYVGRIDHPRWGSRQEEEPHHTQRERYERGNDVLAKEKSVPKPEKDRGDVWRDEERAVDQGQGYGECPDRCFMLKAGLQMLGR